MVIVKGKKTEEIIPYREANKEKRKISTNGRGRSAEEQSFGLKETFTLKTTSVSARQPARPIAPTTSSSTSVENAVGLVLKGKFEAFRRS